MSFRGSIAIAICGILFICGCKRPIPPSATIGTGSYATVNASAWYAFRGNDVFVVVWLDTPAHVSSSSAPDRAWGTIAGRNGKIIGLDYRNGVMQIGGTDYDLSKGGMFLLHSKETPARVVQLPRHTPYSNSPAPAVIELARGDADVREFVAAAGATTVPSTAPTR